MGPKELNAEGLWCESSYTEHIGSRGQCNLLDQLSTRGVQSWMDSLMGAQRSFLWVEMGFPWLWVLLHAYVYNIKAWWKPHFMAHKSYFYFENIRQERKMNKREREKERNGGESWGRGRRNVSLSPQPDLSFLSLSCWCLCHTNLLCHQQARIWALLL